MSQLESTARITTSSPSARTLQMAHKVITTCINTNSEQYQWLNPVPLLLQIRVKACWWKTYTHLYTYGLFPVAGHSVHLVDASQTLASSSCCNPELSPLSHQLPTLGGCHIHLFSQYSALISLTCIHRTSDRKCIHPNDS